MHFTIWPAAIGFAGHWLLDSEPLMVVGIVALFAHWMLLPFVFIAQDTIASTVANRRIKRATPTQAEIQLRSQLASPLLPPQAGQRARDFPSTDAHPEAANPELATARLAASRHLERSSGNALTWLRTNLQQPFVEHLSFRLGNQLFFVHLDLGEQTQPSPNWDQLLLLAEHANGIACIMPMRREIQGFAPTAPGWGLIHASNGSAVDALQESARPPVPMSDWEIQDFAVQIVCSCIEKEGGRIITRHAYPTLHPSILYKDAEGVAWVIVRSTRYPKKAAPRPNDLAALQRTCETTSRRGYFASVALAGAGNSLSDLPRGGGAYANFSGLEPLN